MVLDHTRHVLQGDNDIGNAMAFEEIDNMRHIRFIDDRNHWFRTPDRHWSKTASFATCHQDCFHAITSFPQYSIFCKTGQTAHELDCAVFLECKRWLRCERRKYLYRPASLP